jgi:hypothetical protein
MPTEFAAGRRPSLIILAAALVAATLLLASLASAASASGPAPLAPNNGKHFKVGAFLTFKVRDRSAAARANGIFMRISDRKKVKHGQLQASPGNGSGDFAKMKRRKHGIYTYTPRHYTFPTWYMQKPDVYYWQAHHIDCSPGAPNNCDIVGKIRHFRVG